MTARGAAHDSLAPLAAPAVLPPPTRSPPLPASLDDAGSIARAVRPRFHSRHARPRAAGGRPRGFDRSARAPRRSSRRGAIDARPDGVPGLAQGVGGVGSRRPERGRGDPPRRRGRRVDAAADPRLCRLARGLRPPPPGRPGRRARAHRPTRLRGQLDGPSVRSRTTARSASTLRTIPRRSRSCRSTSRATTTARDHKPVRWRLLPAASPYGWVDFGVLRPARRAGVRLRVDLRARSARQEALVSAGLRLGRRGGRDARRLERRSRSCATTSIATSTPSASRRRRRCARGGTGSPRRCAATSGRRCSRSASPGPTARRTSTSRWTPTLATRPRRAARSWPSARASQRPRRPSKGPFRPSSASRRATTPRARGVRPLPRRDRLGRSDRASSPRARPPCRREGADHPAACCSPARSPRAATSARRGSTRPRRSSRRAARRRARRSRPSSRERRTPEAASTGATRSPTTSVSSRSTPTTCRPPSRRSSSTRRRASATRRSRCSDRRSRTGRAAWACCARPSPPFATRDARPRPTRWPSDTPRCGSTTPRSRGRASSSRSRAATKPRRARWIDRLIATNPDSAGALEASAQAWSRLGERARAIAAYRAALDLAPEDTDMMRQLATVYAIAGERDEQLRLLKRVLELMPQAKDVRDEVAHIAPAAPRPDEQYARPASEFLAKRAAPGGGQARRTLVDLQVTTVFPNGLASRFHQVVYQPLTEAAAAAVARVRVRRTRTTARPSSSAPRACTGADGRIDEAVESGAGAMEDDPAVSMYTSARSYYVRFPRLEPGDVVELQFRVEDVAQRNEFADYFGEVAYMQSAEPIGAERVRAHDPQGSHVLLQRAARPGARALGRGARRPAHLPFRARDVPAMEQEALQPPWTEVLGHVNVSTYKSWDDLGSWYWGLVERPARRRRRGPPARRGADPGAQGRPREGPRDLRLRGPEDAVRRSRVRDPRLQAVPMRADLRARLRRLQRQGDPHRHDARRARHQGHAGRRSDGQQGRHRDESGEPRAVRSHDRVRALARPLPGRDRGVHRLPRAAGDGPRRAGHAGQRRQPQAGSPARSPGDRQRQFAHGRREARPRRRRAGRLARGGQWSRGVRVARALPRRVDAKAARAADDRDDAARERGDGRRGGRPRGCRAGGHAACSRKGAAVRPDRGRRSRRALDPARAARTHGARFRAARRAQARRAHVRAVDAGRRLDRATAARREGEERHQSRRRGRARSGRTRST